MHLMDFAVFTLGWLGGVWAGIWWVTKTEDNKETRDILIDFGASVEEIHDAAAQVLVDKYHMTDCDFDLDYGTDWGQETEVVSVYSSDT